ncbi:MspA family porin [Gordonia sp. CPCC 205333]|uniref:MspA family porin n=1 Tax=Gordonia sp. CPCC 205333 TaxID=3140790 RepID=UPI003AF35B65
MRHPISRLSGLAGFAAAAVAATVLTGTGSASADTFVRLPNGTATGDGISLTRTNESARVSPSLAANGASRTTWVTGTVKLRAPKLESSKAGPSNGPAGEGEIPGSNGTATNGAAATLSTGYIIGCQVDISGLAAGLSGTLSTTAPSLSGTLTVPMAAGRVVFLQIEVKDIEGPGTYYIGYDHAQVNIQNCGGYAQARAFTTVETTGNPHQKINLYGKPFSIG